MTCHEFKKVNELYGTKLNFFLNYSISQAMIQDVMKAKEFNFKYNKLF